MITKKVPKYLCVMVRSFLSQRSIEMYAGRYRVRAGCPQRSCFMPTLWFLIMEDPLEEEEEGEGIYVQAFADDLVAVTGVKKVEKCWEELWTKLRGWEERNRLNFKVNKREAMFVPVRRKIREPVIRMKKGRIERKNCLLRPNNRRGFPVHRSPQENKRKGLQANRTVAQGGWEQMGGQGGNIKGVVPAGCQTDTGTTQNTLGDLE